MNIFLQDLKFQRRNFLIWTVSIVAFCVWIISLYPSFAASGLGSFEDYFQELPDSFMKAFGVDRLDLTSIWGFFGTEAHLIIILFGSMYSSILASSLLSREESLKTVEFLLSKPIKRSQVITQKLFASTTIVVIFNIIVWISTYTSILYFCGDNFDKIAFWNLALMTLLVTLTFANISFLGSIFVVRPKSLHTGALALVLIMYALQIASDLSDKLNFLKYITPMKWASAPDIITNGIDSVYLLLILVVNILAVTGSYTVYGRKDILT
jgi:ABC-2 type transport system permease protein